MSRRYAFGSKKPIYIEACFDPHTIQSRSIHHYGNHSGPGLSWYRAVSNLKRFEIHFSRLLFEGLILVSDHPSTLHCRSTVRKECPCMGINGFFNPLNKVRYYQLNLPWTTAWLIKMIHHSRRLEEINSVYSELQSTFSSPHAIEICESVSTIWIAKFGTECKRDIT